MNIIDIYERYKVMPQLQLHQLRVAAVAKMICNNFDEPLNEKNIVTACLLHDMANIIKADLTYFPEFLEPEGSEYWQKVKDHFIETYGADEHHATVEIAKSLNLPEEVVYLIDRFGFSKAAENEKLSNDVKICVYVDMRVGPYGMLSLQERLDEGRERYKNHPNKRPGFSESINRAALKRIEKYLFSHSAIKPEDITDESCAPIIEKLKNYNV